MNAVSPMGVPDEGLTQTQEIKTNFKGDEGAVIHEVDEEHQADELSQNRHSIMKGAIGLNKSQDGTNLAGVQDTQQNFTKDERIEKSRDDSQSEI